MIHYQLRCGADHQFDGWFASSAGFDRQAASGLVACPHCGDTQVNRALMAPALAVSRPVPDAPGAADRTQAVAGDGLPDGIRAALQRVRAEVERTCDNVGPAFAEEVRRMHRGEAERRGIYGDSTPEQAQALADEGIEVARIPWMPRADS